MVLASEGDKTANSRVFHAEGVPDARAGQVRLARLGFLGPVGGNREQGYRRLLMESASRKSYGTLGTIVVSSLLRGSGFWIGRAHYAGGDSQRREPC